LNNVSYKKAVDDLKFVYSENTLSIVFKNNDILMGVVGEFNNNLKELEKITKTSIYSRGNSILVKNTPKKNDLVKNAIVFLFDQFINNGTMKKRK
jgi:Phosphate starvation-inducible protein PhoH, predicted ATPase